MELDLIARRVAMDDNLAETAAMGMELAPDPHQVMRILKIQRNAGPHSGMAKEIVPSRIRMPEPCKETAMMGRHEACKLARKLEIGAGLASRIDAIGGKRLNAAPMEKSLGFARRGKKALEPLVMIAAKADEIIPFRESRKHLHDIAGTRTAVGIVAEHDNSGFDSRITGAVGHDSFEEVGKAVGHAMDIAHGIDSQARRKACLTQKHLTQGHGPGL